MGQEVQHRQRIKLHNPICGLAQAPDMLAAHANEQNAMRTCRGVARTNINIDYDCTGDQFLPCPDYCT